MTQVVQRNNHVLQVLKRLKETLDSDKKKYADKVNVLVMTWERIAASAREQRPLAAICIVEKMYKDTLSVMLQGEWPKMSPVSKTHLIQMLNRCRTDLCKHMPWLHTRFKKLLELVNDPWTLPSLERILHREPCPPTSEQIVEFCVSERGLLIITRLNMLCSSRCEKVAIKLAEACYGALSSGTPALMSLFSTNEYNFIFDIYLCLLYKYKKLDVIINTLKTVSVTDGYYLVVRLRKRIDLHEQKIWKFSLQVAAVAARYFVTVSMLSRPITNPSLIKNLIIDWLSMITSMEHNVENEVRKVMQPAETSEHIYLMAEVLTALSQQLGNDMYRSLIIELYIRAVTADINYLERVKLQNDKEQLTAYEKHLASKFLALADLVKGHSGVRREFVLTAFSIHPSAEIYRRVEEEAVASGKASPHSTPTSQESIEVGVLSEGLSSMSSEEPDSKETAIDYSVNNDSQDSGAFLEIANRCPLHLPYDGIGPEGELCFQCGDFTGIQTPHTPTNQQQKKKERSLDALILIKGNTVTESLNYDALCAPSQVLEAEKLGLSPQVCADLVTLLGSNRYHLLTWVLEWGELSSRCLRYMDEADTIKSGKKELKFLEIDYNQYKDWPENDDEGDCIEKGYEHWLDDENTETDIDTDSKRSNTDDSEEMMIKTAIRRSQKQMGRYAESSSDSEDSRSRARHRKRGRPRKRLKFYSDSGSVSDSLGSDGQKQKRSGNKHRTKSKDLRKRLGRLKVLEMAGEAQNFSPSNDSMSSEAFCLPNAGVGRSDPTVLKSLRAFRPNPHKSKTDEFVSSVTESCYNPKVFSDRITPSVKPNVFDCNDNRFMGKGERFSFANNDMEIHFKTTGVKTKQYKDVMSTIKNDLMSVSNIPNVVNNATVNVFHVQNSKRSGGSCSGIQSAAPGFRSKSVPSTLASRNTNLVNALQKPKSENESQGSQIRKSSSQSLSQNSEMNRFRADAASRRYIDAPPVTTTTPNNPGSVYDFPVTEKLEQSANKFIGQQECTNINRNSYNQNILKSQNQNDGSRSSHFVGSFATANNLINSRHSFAPQTPRTPQTVRAVTASVPTSEAAKVEKERLSVGLPQVSTTANNVGSQNWKAGAQALSNHVISGLNYGTTQAQKSDSNAIKTNVESSKATAEVARPVVEPAKPNKELSRAFAQPVTNNMELAKHILEPVRQVLEPNQELAQSFVEPVKPNTELAKVIVEPVEAYTEFTRPIDEPIEIKTELSENIVESVQPNPELTKHIVEPIQIKTEPTEVIEEPVKSNTELARSIAVSVRPVSEPETSYIEVTSHVSEPETSYIEVTSHVSEPETSYIEVTRHVSEPETSYIEVTRQVSEPETSYIEVTRQVSESETCYLEVTRPVLGQIRPDIKLPMSFVEPIKSSINSSKSTTEPAKTTKEPTNRNVVPVRREVEVTQPKILSRECVDQNVSNSNFNSKSSLDFAVQRKGSSAKATTIASKPTDPQKSFNEISGFSSLTSSDSGIVNVSKANTTTCPPESEVNLYSKANSANKPSTYSKNSVNTDNVSDRISPQTVRTNTSSPSETVALENVGSVENKNSLSELLSVKRDLDSTPCSFTKTENVTQNLDEANVLHNVQPKSLSVPSAEENIASHSGLNTNVSVGSPLTLDVRNISSADPSTADPFLNGAYDFIANDTPQEEVIVSDLVTPDSSILTPPLDNMECSTSSVVNQKSVSESDKVAALESTPSSKPNTTTTLMPVKNTLASVLKKHPPAKTFSAPAAAPQYSFSTLRIPTDGSNVSDAVQNIMVSQKSNSSTIHYTVVSPVQQNIQNLEICDGVGRVIRQEDFVMPQQMMMPQGGQVTSSNSNTFSINVRDVEQVKRSFQETVNQQQILIESKRAKPGSSLPTVQTESNFIKKQVLNNQQITILVQSNDGGDVGKPEIQPRGSKVNEVVFRDDKKTCITFRAIKRPQPDGIPVETPVKKKAVETSARNQNGGTLSNVKQVAAPQTAESTAKADSNSSETLCQYLVLEAINDPSGSLPKFNQAFGKSYQVKLPQAIKPVEINEGVGNEGSFGVAEQRKVNAKVSNDVGVTHPNQVLVAESPIGENTFEIVQKPVKSVYIDKEVKSNVHHVKTNEGTFGSSNISTIQMTEVQQPTVNTYQAVPKVGRSSVVQHFLRKVPATGPTTLQAVNSINSLTARPLKAQDVVSSSTLIYATDSRAQSQIVIQRAVGRVAAPAVRQVAPVVYTQSLGEQSLPQTQTLLLTTVPTGTRGVVPATQLVRLPPSSGVWKMAPTVNPPRIVQLRPQNLVLQGAQDQSVMLHNVAGGQPVVLHQVTSLPVKPIGVVTNELKTDHAKIDVKNNIYNKSVVSIEDPKLCSVSLEVEHVIAKNGATNPATAVTEHETVSLMKDIKEFENVFEETKLKFEMEEQQSVCLSEIETITPAKAPFTTVNVHASPLKNSVHQTLVVQPQLMLHKPQMIITSAVPTQQTIFTQKIDKPITIAKDQEKTLILTAKPKVERNDNPSRVAVTYVSRPTVSAGPPAVTVQKPLVVVTSYAQPPASPVSSITSQNSSSPSTVASTVPSSYNSPTISTPPIKTQPKSKPRPSKSNSSSNRSKSPPSSKNQQKPNTEDPNTAQKIYAILEEYAVQLRNSPDVNNRPAPRRRLHPIPGLAKRRKSLNKNKDTLSDGEETNFVEETVENLPLSEESSSNVTILQVCVSSSSQ